MIRKIAIIVFFIIFPFGTMVNAHSGRTDSSGGHNCSSKSISKGLCTGYHYHNGGGSSSGGSSSNISAATRNDKDCSDFATYDEVVEYWNVKGYSATYDPENLDGWGNGVVDDGIPCEAPGGYDKTKINNSPEQAQFKQNQQDSSNGESQGYKQGVEDGYQEASNNSEGSTGTDAFNQGYSIGYYKGYEEGKKKIDSEKKFASEEGYSLGQKQDNLDVPDKYASYSSLKSSFEEGFNKAVSERVEAKQAEFIDLGYQDGKNDIHSPPVDVQEVFITAYQEGYDKGQNELKEEYFKLGYADTFTMVTYENPNLPNEKFTEWYKQGFESNKEINEIKDFALSLGASGEEQVIPFGYKKAEKVFSHYYELGYKEYLVEKKENQTASAGGVGILALSWLGRRLYVAKNMIG
ncbi:YHYH domain-containing protein [Bacillus sp. DJP31]|uniref:YHYH domain-containing protein n=1 Tax=Bacillus sp. DJP31 TaxID=3409789 RepID=UPI003BB50D13